MMQSFTAGRYRGKRVRLTAELRTEEVVGAGTIWMRIDGVKRAIRFDNMETRTADGVLRDTTDWTRREVVLDVPADAESIHFGFYLRGAWKHVGAALRDHRGRRQVPVTSTEPALADGPTNLDFSDIAGDLTPDYCAVTGAVAPGFDSFAAAAAAPSAMSTAALNCA